ncbi:MAG: cupin domain-containing protein [Pseudonocardiaceae bacterium]
MSYPDPRYFKDTGEISATFRPATINPDFVSSPVQTAGPTVSRGTAYHYLATNASTAGEFGLYRVDMGPEVAGPSTHFHKTISESFFILSGTMRLYDGEGWVDAGPGDFLYVPVGGLHAFRNESGQPVSMLLLFAPGASRETYFEQVSQIAQLSDAERQQFLIEHDSYFV